jgi:hypothetical protein
MHSVLPVMELSMCTFTYGFPLPQLIEAQQGPMTWVLILAIPFFIVYYLLFVRTITPPARRGKAERRFSSQSRFTSSALP